MTQSYLDISSGLFIWYSLISEIACRYLNDIELSAFGGRVRKHSSVLAETGRVDLLLVTLDDLQSVLVRHMLMDEHYFKGRLFLAELSSADSSRTIWPLISPIVRRLIEAHSEEDLVVAMRQLFQLFSLLKKLRVDRSDLESQMEDEFFAKESDLVIEESYQKRRFDGYFSLVTRMSAMLKSTISEFDPRNIRPKHGPGAVASPGVKHRRDKYLDMCFDARIGYMLEKTGPAPYGSYCSSPRKSCRTSRFICVPKTWKTLRGISAEPTELQYFQQGLMVELDRCIGRHLSRSIDLHDQEISRKMTISASRTKSYATIDLEAASDSVTVQLVKDIFGNSSLARWLLASRSTSTLVGDRVTKIRRFAPMGSAVCFPVECLIFWAASMCAVRSNNLHRSFDMNDVRVFGDDLIVPLETSHTLIENLHILGFKVNTEKSCMSGTFRESCGEFAWRGESISPLRYKTVEKGIFSTQHSYVRKDQMTSLFNQLEERGFHKTRSYLLARFLSGNVKIGLRRGNRKKVLNVPSSWQLIFSWHGENSTVLSSHPSNFHLVSESSSRLQLHHKKVVEWVPKERDYRPEDDSWLYQEWLLRTSGDSRNESPVVYDLEFFRNLTDPVEPRLVMIPTISRKDIEWATRKRSPLDIFP
nr:MAG: RNA-dependent RNA polymerase [Riboviria sp.]